MTATVHLNVRFVDEEKRANTLPLNIAFITSFVRNVNDFHRVGQWEIATIKHPVPSQPQTSSFGSEYFSYVNTGRPAV